MGVEMGARLNVSMPVSTRDMLRTWLCARHGHLHENMRTCRGIRVVLPVGAIDTSVAIAYVRILYMTWSLSGSFK